MDYKNAYKEIKNEMVKVRNDHAAELDKLQSELSKYEAKLPDAEAAANKAALDDDIKKFGTANKALNEVRDAIEFYTRKVEVLKDKGVFEDADRIVKDIERIQRRIDNEAMDKAEGLLVEACAIIDDAFTAIMEGNQLKTETGIDAMNYYSPHFYRVDEMKVLRRNLTPYRREHSNK